jgi:hypothetical protein
MAISDIYSELLLEQMISNMIQSGQIPDILSIASQFETLTANLNLSIPQFVSSTYYVTDGEHASATKYDNTFTAIAQDLRVLYKESLAISTKAVNDYERWQTEVMILEKNLLDLQTDITNLLALTQDSISYFGTIQDNFTDTSMIDQDHTTTAIDITHQIISLPKVDLQPTRIFLNDLTDNDITFNVRNTIDFVSRADAIGTNLTNIFNQTISNWWTQLLFSSPQVVVCELIVQLSTSPITISKIDIQLHDSSQSSPMSITPLYSVDNYTFTQLPTINYTQTIRSNGNFTFSPIKAQWVKFLLTKSGPDPSNGGNQFSYEFGFNSIAFYNEQFSTTVSENLVSKSLYILNNEGLPTQFSRVAIETCERLEDTTSINWFITPSNDPTVPLTSGITWYQLTPQAQKVTQYPNILDFGDTSNQTLGLSGTNTSLGISYTGKATNPLLVNPGATFSLLSAGVNGALITNTITCTVPRYVFVNTNDRLLNYQIKDSNYSGSGSGTALTIDENDLILFRNKGSIGFYDADPTSKVRGIQKGWSFTDPYYYTTIQILNPNGISINVGNSPMIIDELSYTNVVSNTVLTGKVGDSTGIHHIQVHKDNWLAIEPNASSLAALQGLDNLYPYNQKLLIEGYQYGPTYPTNEPKVYTGVDLFAELVMKKCSLFDLVNNIKPDNYTYFALDYDLPGTHPGGNNPTRVFLLKVDNQNPDFQNEEFVLEFVVINQKYGYLRLKAELSTINAGNTPALTGYKIKLA